MGEVLAKVGYCGTPLAIEFGFRDGMHAASELEGLASTEALMLDRVDVKVAAIDDIRSGLKLVIRKERRLMLEPTPSNSPDPSEAWQKPGGMTKLCQLECREWTR